MLKLILRQLRKYRTPLFILLAFWAATGFVIFQQRFELLSFLYRLTVQLPDPGTQDHTTAYDFVRDARDALAEEDIDLQRMANSCPATFEHTFRPDEEFFRPDWLQRYLQQRDFTYAAGQPADHYWMTHRETVSTALHYALEATLYAYELPAEVTGAEPVLIPELVESLAAALCNPYPALRTWGNYVAFQEHRAYRELSLSESDEARLSFPSERELLALGALRGNATYVKALRRYAGGPAPADPEEPCTDFRLVCISAREAARITDRLIYVSPEDRHGMLYLNQARIYLRLKQSDYREKALHRYAGAAAFRTSEVPARLEMASLLVSEERYDEAYRQLHILDVILGPERHSNAAFRSLARRVLMGSGRFVEADCFSDEADRGGQRPACIDFRL